MVGLVVASMMGYGLRRMSSPGPVDEANKYMTRVHDVMKKVLEVPVNFHMERAMDDAFAAVTARGDVMTKLLAMLKTDPKYDKLNNVLDKVQSAHLLFEKCESHLWIALEEVDWSLRIVNAMKTASGGGNDHLFKLRVQIEEVLKTLKRFKKRAFNRFPVERVSYWCDRIQRSMPQRDSGLNKVCNLIERAQTCLDKDDDHAPEALKLMEQAPKLVLGVTNPDFQDHKEVMLNVIFDAVDVLKSWCSEGDDPMTPAQKAKFYVDFAIDEINRALMAHFENQTHVLESDSSSHWNIAMSSEESLILELTERGLIQHDVIRQEEKKKLTGLTEAENAIQGELSKCQKVMSIKEEAIIDLKAAGKKLKAASAIKAFQEIAHYFKSVENYLYWVRSALYWKRLAVITEVREVLQKPHIIESIQKPCNKEAANALEEAVEKLSDANDMPHDVHNDALFRRHIDIAKDWLGDLRQLREQSGTTNQASC